MRLIEILLFFLISGQLFGTTQIPDFVIYQRDTLPIRSAPLEEYLNRKGDRKIGGIEMKSNCTALWKGYVGTWKIEKDSLFLVGIETNCCGKNPIKIDIRKEFGLNKVFADWVSLEIVIPFGKQISYIHQGCEAIYEYEKGFEFINGKLIRINNYNNSKSRKSVSSKDAKTIHKFFYKNIDWNLVESQKLGNPNRVIIKFQVDKDGKPIEIEIIRGINQQIDKEAERIVKLIPEWDVCYRKGNLVKIQWILPIRFDKQFYISKNYNLDLD